MHFLYPQDLLEPRLVDEMFREEAVAVQGRGHSVSLMDSNTFAVNARTFQASADSGVVYRGWMLAPAEYETLLASLDRLGATPKTSLEQYLSTHYLPNCIPFSRTSRPRPSFSPLRRI